MGKSQRRTPREGARRKYRKSLQKRASLSKRYTEDPGYGFTYSVKDKTLRLEVDMSTKGKVSNSGKSRTLASSQGPFNLDSLGFKGCFLIAYVCKRIPLEKLFPVKKIMEDIQREADEQ